MSYTESVNRDIKKLNFTNLYLAEILISDYINNSNNYDGMTISEISNAWHLQRTNGRYRKQFYPSYCQRKISQGNGLLNYNTISQKFTISDDADDLALLLNGSLLQEIRAAINSPNPIIDNIRYFESVESQGEFFNRLRELFFKGTPNDFEVIGFSILSLYLELYGFSLKRFTSTNANDGGVDFIGGDIVYCVTTNLNRNKLETDIVKTHAKKVFIYRTPINQNLNSLIANYISEGKISDIISAGEIEKHHLSYLESKRDDYEIMQRLKQRIITEYNKEIL